MSQYSVLVAFFFYLCTLTWIITLRELKAILSSRALRFTRYVTQFLHNFITISTSNMVCNGTSRLSLRIVKGKKRSENYSWVKKKKKVRTVFHKSGGKDDSWPNSLKG